MSHREAAALEKIKHLVDFILENIDEAFFFFCSVLFPCTYTQFKWYPICILTISFTHQYSIDRSQSMSETSGLLLFLAARWDVGPLYLQINVTAERKHVTVTFSLVIHDQELFNFFYFLFAGRFSYAGILCASSAAACRMGSDSGAPHGGEPASFPASRGSRSSRKALICCALCFNVYCLAGSTWGQSDWPSAQKFNFQRINTWEDGELWLESWWMKRSPNSRRSSWLPPSCVGKHSSAAN